MICLVGKVFSQDAQNGKNSIQLFEAIKMSQDPVEQEKLLEQMLALIGNKEDRQSTMLVNFGTQYVSLAYADSGDAIKAIEIKDRIKDREFREETALAVARSLIKNKKYEEAKKLLDGRVKAIDVNAERISGAYVQPVVLYGDILFGEGAYEQAIPYLRHSLKAGEYFGENRERYVLALIKTDKAESPLVESVFLEKGKRSAGFLEGARAFLRQSTGSDVHYDRLTDSAKRLEEKRITDKVLAMKTDRPAPDFVIKDLNGKEISLASLKGKTVILDFWATWCIPCIASFPGMQKAVDYYKNDPSVVFMFIHTAEKDSGTAASDARKLIESKGYTFDVYMDVKDPATGKNPMLTAFGLQSLPTKFVISKEGVIKFSHSGYVEENEAVEEINMMVKLANE